MPVGQGHEATISSSGCIEFVGSLFEFLAKVEDLLFELDDSSA